MQQFTVPQFIDIEDKIIGPITVRQFLIMLVWGATSAIFYRVFDFVLFITLAIILFVIAGIFAFFKVNGMPFHFVILNLLQTLKKPKIRIWNNQLANSGMKFKEIGKETEPTIAPIAKKQYSKSRLAELSLIVDTGGGYQGGDQSVKVLEEEHRKKTLI